jgi:hypothetical protein
MSSGPGGFRGGRALRAGISIGLACLIATQAAPPAAGAQAEGAPGLQIVILDGEGAINNIRQRTAREPIVQVQDENHRPVAGAVVVFSLPERGAGGAFANGSTTMTVTTDAQGRAVATGLRPNSVQGNFQIHVSASNQGRTATAVINQTNSLSAAAAAGGISAKTLAIILAVGGGAAVGGIVAATRGGRSAPTAAPGPPATTITAGTPTVSAPR